MGGKCLIVISAIFQKWEENVRLSLANFKNWEEGVQLSYWQSFKNGRKMSNSHSANFSKPGGKCVGVTLNIFQTQEEIVLW
jgi:hypothetical protein